MEKLFVLVRNDLPISNQAVQAGHALAQWMIDCRMNSDGYNPKWSNEILVYLSVENEVELENWRYKFDHKFLLYSSFREPDLNDSLTAIAVMCPDSVVSKLSLMGSN